MEVLVETPSRLHFGFFNFSCSSYKSKKSKEKRRGSSAGVAIQKPNFIIKAKYSNSEKLIIESEDERAIKYTKLFIEKFNLKKKLKVKILKNIPEHVGLGSGTQLALGIGIAIVKLFKLKISIEEIAEISGRGKISGVGIYAFKHGGFIVDSSEKIFHSPLPENWLWIVAIPKDKKGLFGRKEKNAFTHATLKKIISDKDIIKLKRIKMQMIRGAEKKDIEKFGKAITNLDKFNGILFSKIQKGIYYDKDVEKGVKILLENGAFGVGQSSWGPSFYGLTEGERSSLKLKNKLQEFLNKKWKILITKTANKGFRVV